MNCESDVGRIGQVWLPRQLVYCNLYFTVKCALVWAFYILLAISEGLCVEKCTIPVLYIRLYSCRIGRLHIEVGILTYYVHLF